MAKRYQVSLHSQMGPREGLLTLEQKGTYVSGCLELVGHENIVQGVRAGDGNIHIFHPIQTAVSTLPCETVLELRDGRLTGTTTAETCLIRWEGILLSEELPVKVTQEELKR